ncbi:hypothetical protein P8C59_008202 [Phyllachora maydis]|uniref:Uncharacterized protein n=1 Tax=Phyllachora maydis TaxID=1825666 RepID=A0AAD9MGJ0_9PEZI|nr:hypothetical protein P8C59_008202 [Phyllachora maydis]
MLANNPSNNLGPNATILWRKEEAEEKAVYKAEIAIYKARLSKYVKHALPTSPAAKKAANTSSSDGKFVIR